jgi:hypothetical protein
MNIPEHIIVLVMAAVEDHRISLRNGFNTLCSMLPGINEYSPPEGRPDPLEQLNQEVRDRLNPPEMISALLDDLLGENTTKVHCQQAVDVIRQLLGDRPADQVPLQVEDR